jgi:hypothetical protein
LETEHVEHRKKSVAGAETEFAAGPVVARVAMTLTPAIGVTARKRPLFISGAVAVATNSR